MAGKLPGMYFKLVIGNLLSVQVMFPGYKKRIDEMDANTMYPWTEYTDMTQHIASNMPTATMIQIGKKIVRDSKTYFMSQGFDTAEKILSNWAALFTANIVGAPREDLVRTVEYTPGHAVIVGGVVQPAALVEGYLRGVVEMFGHRVTHFDCRVVSQPGGEKANQFRIDWAS